jgi:hypothetical protein
MAELKPCPFCGGRAMLIDIPHTNIHNCAVRCVNVHCVMHPTTHIYVEPKSAIEAWNRRADYVPAADVVEVVRCKDCRWATELNEFEKRCYVEGCVACRQIHQLSERTIMLPDDFCSCGERNTNDNRTEN